MSVLHCTTYSRYLSTGLSFQALSDSFLMSPYTISLIVNEVCGVIFDTFVDKHMAVPSRDQFKQIAADYEDQWDFPHVIGLKSFITNTSFVVRSYCLFNIIPF